MFYLQNINQNTQKMVLVNANEFTADVTANITSQKHLY